jgi:capsular exopolysaccharide synthesis family protein
MRIEKSIIGYKSKRAVKNAYEILTANMKIGGKGKVRTKSYVMISSNPAEGKTTIALGLAKTTAAAGFKTLLVDADLRKPLKIKRMKTKSNLGLADYLISRISFDEAVSDTCVDNLNFISSGKDNKNPMSLLMGNKFDEFIDIVERKYDVVIIDTPAVSEFFDGAIIASKVDSAIIIAKKASTTLKEIKDLEAKLSKLDAKIAGVVINKGKKGKKPFNLQEYKDFLIENKPVQSQSGNK